MTQDHILLEGRNSHVVGSCSSALACSTSPTHCRCSDVLIHQLQIVLETPLLVFNVMATVIITSTYKKTSEMEESQLWPEKQQVLKFVVAFSGLLAVTQLISTQNVHYQHELNVYLLFLEYCFQQSSCVTRALLELKQRFSPNYYIIVTHGKHHLMLTHSNRYVLLLEIKKM